ncbi:hypothetical protein SESBI_38791 [Sesbania bispinosa]|nr:hypothetical protein SESBI_38791 [Sesbania bispinosa]
MEDDDFLEDNQEHHVDLVVPFKKSVKQIIREEIEIDLDIGISRPPIEKVHVRRNKGELKGMELGNRPDFNSDGGAFIQ